MRPSLSQLAIALCLCAALPVTARADQIGADINNPSAYTATDFPNFVTDIPHLSMDTSLGSLHFPSSLSGGPHLNDFNPGVGLEAPLALDYTMMAGAYRNSYRRTSLYAAVSVTPWAWRLQPGGWRWLVRPGFVAGVVSGYDRSENPAAPLFAAGLLQIRDAQTGVGFNLIGMPRVDGQAGFVGIQLVTPILP